MSSVFDLPADVQSSRLPLTCRRIDRACRGPPRLVALGRSGPMINSEKTETRCAENEIPSNASGKNIHMILEIHDNGSPNLYAYRRVIINVQ